MQVFEHQKVTYQNQELFKEKHLAALRTYHQKHGSKYFTLLYNGVKFKQYVGVLQVGDLTIEILPKADLSTRPDTQKWQHFLIDILKETAAIPITSLSEAALKTKPGSLLDWYIEVFLSETKALIRKGFIRQYSTKTANTKSLKGRLVMQEHFTKNYIHKERFYTSHQVYDTDHIFHHILKNALSILKTISSSPTIVNKVNQLLFDFQHISDSVINPQIFKHINYTRKTLPYKTAIQLAQLIIQQYTPSLQHGNLPILAILFDMNMLFEKYVLKQFKKLLSEYNISILNQPITTFWQEKTLRPDILIQANDKKYLFDTKWKVLEKPQPNDSDLRQMYVYQQYFDADQSVLIYPRVNEEKSYFRGDFKSISFKNQSLPTQSCDLYFVGLTTLELRADLKNLLQLS